MKKIFFAAALVAISFAFVSCDADSIDSDISTTHADDTGMSGGSGGAGGTTPITPPPPPPPPKNLSDGR